MLPCNPIQSTTPPRLAGRLWPDWHRRPAVINPLNSPHGDGPLTGQSPIPPRWPSETTNHLPETPLGSEVGISVRIPAAVVQPYHSISTPAAFRTPSD